MKKKTTYFISYDQKGVVWGHGLSAEKAEKDADASIIDYLKWNSGERRSSYTIKVAPATKAFYKDIKDNGWCDQEWYIFNDYAQTVYEALGGKLGARINILVSK